MKYLIEQFFKIEGWQNKLAVIWKGPGWQIGSPRLGFDDFPPIQHPIKVYHPNISTALAFYTFVHFLYATAQFSVVLRDAKVKRRFAFQIRSNFVFV